MKHATLEGSGEFRRLLAGFYETPQIHYWCCLLNDNLKGKLLQLDHILSDEEVKEISKAKTPARKKRLTVNRTLLKVVLSTYTKEEPSAIEIWRNKTGKPFVRQGTISELPCFNVSHSRNLNLIAISSAGAVGIDAEFCRNRSGLEVMVSRFYDSHEIAEINTASSPDERERMIYRIWCRKEAKAKLSGQGVRAFLSELKETNKDLTNQMIVPAHDKPDVYIEELKLESGFVGALAHRSDSSSLYCIQDVDLFERLNSFS